MCCLGDEPDTPENDAAREAVVEDVLLARPNLDLLCIGGPRPSAGAGDEFVTESWLDFGADASSRGAGVLGVRFACETDGATAPLRATFRTVTFEGQASEVVLVDPPTQATLSDAEDEEGDTLSFIVRLDSAATVPIQLEYSTVSVDEPGETDATADDTGWSGNDYTAASGAIVTISPGEVTATIDIETTEDSLFERDETFEVHVVPVAAEDGAGVPVQLATGVVTGRILNDDDPPLLSFYATEVAALEGESLSFALKLGDAGGNDVISGLPATIEVAYLDISDEGEGLTAAQDFDFDFPSENQIVVSPGQSSPSINIVTHDDQVAEDDETLRVRLHQPVDATLPDGLASHDANGTINDDEPRLVILKACGIIDYENTSACALEGNPVEFEITLSRPLTPTDNPVTVDVATQQIPRALDLAEEPATEAARDETAISNVDFTAVANTKLTFEAPRDEGDEVRTVITVAVETIHDELYESPSESFQLQLIADSWSENTRVVGTDPDERDRARFGLGAIIDDDDPPEIVLTGPQISVEEGEPAQFRLELSAASGKDVWVHYYTSNVEATGGGMCTGMGAVDFEEVDPLWEPELRRVVFDVDTARGIGPTEATIEVSTCDDSIDEDDEEEFEFVATDPVGAVFVLGDPQIAAVKIRDNDTALISVDPASASEPISEDFVGTIAFKVKLSTPSDKVITVDIETRDRAASNTAAIGDEDYVSISNETLTFAAGEVEKTVLVVLRHDVLDELNEQFDFVISNATNAGILGGADALTVQGTILDNDNPPELTISLLDEAAVSEGETITFVAVLSAVSGLNVDFEYRTFDGTAIGGDVNRAPNDYRARSAWRPLSLVAGQPSIEIQIETYDNDEVYEGVETFTVELRLPTPTLEFPPTSSATLGTPHEAEGMISDSTDIPVVSVRPSWDLFGYPALTSERGGEIKFVLELSEPSSSDVVVGYVTKDGTDTPVGVGPAVMGQDYVAADNMVTIPAGRQRAEISVALIDDYIEEDPHIEQLDLTISLPTDETGAVLDADKSTAAAQIVDDDVTVGFDRPEQGFFSADEGEEIRFKITLSRARLHDVTVIFHTQSLTTADAANPSSDDTEAADYQSVPETTITIPANQLSATFRVQTFDDDIDEPDETFSASIKLPEPKDLSVGIDVRPAAARIVDGDDEPVVSVAASPDRVIEAPGASVDFSLTLDHPSSQDVDIDYRVTGITATAHVDYDVAEPEGTVTFEAGSVSQTISVTILDDPLTEEEEILQIELSNPAPADALRLGTARAEAAIVDNDFFVSLVEEAVSEVEGEALEFTVRLSGPAVVPTEVLYFTHAMTGEHAATADVDYAHVAYGAPKQVQIDIGQQEATILVASVQDDVHELDEHFQVRLAELQTHMSLTITDGIAVGIIENDESIPEATVQGPEHDVTEGDQALFIVTLEPASSRLVTVAYRTEDGSAIVGDDYIGQVSRASFAPGAQSYTVSVTTTENGVVEEHETFEVVLSDPAPEGAATLGVARAQATVADNDVAVGFDASTASAPEGAGAMQFTVVMSGAVSVDIDVDYHTESITDEATPGTDYVPVSEFAPETLRIRADETEATLRVAISDDDIHEMDETFRVRLTNPRLANPSPGFNALLADRTAVVGTIEDDEQLPRAALGAPDPVDEGDPMTFTVSLSAPSDRRISFSYIIVGGSAQFPDDYMRPASSSVDIEPGDTSATISISTIDDSAAEDDETVELALTSANPAQAVVVDTSIAAGVIGDNDGCVGPGEEPPLLTFTDSNVREDAGTATFRFELFKPFCEDSIAMVRTVDGSAHSGSDFAAVGAEFDISSGNSHFDVPVGIIDDDDAEALEQFSLEAAYDGVVWARASVTIADDDRPTVRISDATAIEGTELKFAVSLDAPAYRPVEVQYDTFDITGGATGGNAEDDAADYQTTSGTLEFVVGGPTALQVVVPTFDNIDDEDTAVEELQLRLRDAVGTDIADGIGVGFIVEGDCVDHTDSRAPLITFSVPAVIAVTEDAIESEGLIPVTFGSRPCSGNISYVVTAEEYGAARGGSEMDFRHGDDFLLTSTTRRYPLEEAGNIRYEFGSSNINDDDLPEPIEETFRVRFDWDAAAMPEHYHGLPPAYTVVTIRDDDAAISVSDASAFAGIGLAFEISLGQPIDTDVTVSYETMRHATGDAPANGGEIADEEQDYIPVNGTVTIAAGEVSAAVVVELIIDEDDSEPDETFLLKLTEATNAPIADDTAVGTIWVLGACLSRPTIEELGYHIGLRPHIPSLNDRQSPIRIPEGIGTRPLGLVFSIRLCDTVTVFPTVVPRYEDLIGVARTRRVNFSVFPGSPSNYFVTRPRLDGLFSADAGIFYSSGRPPNRPVTSPGTLRFAINDDDLYEGDETAYVRYTSYLGRNLISTQRFPILILDNDEPPQVSIADAQLWEGSTTDVIISLSEISGVPATIDYETRAHTSAGASAARAGSDYRAISSGTVTIPPGALTAAVTLETFDDTAREGAETLLIVLTGAAHATVDERAAVVTILDDEACVTPTNPIDEPLSISIDDVTVDEDDGTVSVTVQYSRICAGFVDAVDYGTTPGTATRDSDYITFDEGAIDTDGTTTSRTVTMIVIDDDRYEGEETLEFWAQWGTGLPAAYQSLPRVSGTVTIREDDPRPVVRIEDAGASRNSELEFAIVLEGPSESNSDPNTDLPVNVYWETRVPYSTTDPAEPGEDYVASSGVVSLAPGETAATVTVETLAGVAGDGEETLLVKITNVENADILDGEAVGIIGAAP